MRVQSIRNKAAYTLLAFVARKHSRGEEHLEWFGNVLTTLDHVRQYLQGYGFDSADGIGISAAVVHHTRKVRNRPHPRVRFRRRSVGSPPWRPSFYPNRPAFGRRNLAVTRYQRRRGDLEACGRSVGRWCQRDHSPHRDQGRLRVPLMIGISLHFPGSRTLQSRISHARFAKS